MTQYTPAERDAAWAQLCPKFDLRAAIAQIIDVQCELNRVRAELAEHECPGCNAVNRNHRRNCPVSVWNRARDAAFKEFRGEK